MNHAWTALAAIGALAAAITPYLVHRRQQASRRTEARLARLQAQYEDDLRAIQTLLVCLERVRADLNTVLTNGPLCARGLSALGLAERLDRLEGPLRNQLFGRVGVEALNERVRRVLRSPYPGDFAEPTNETADADRASWVREAIGRGATQQAAAHAALDSLHALTGELQQRELELASKVLTLVGR